MARRDEVREVMRGLVAPEAENFCGAANPAFLERQKNGVPTEASPFSEAQEKVLTELRGQLREHAIETTETEIALALLEGLAGRPALCRGLLAEYLTGEDL